MSKTNTFFKTTLLSFAVLVALLVISGCALLSWPVAEPPTHGIHQPFAISHVNIIDVHDGSVHADRTVLIKDGDILEIVPSAGFTIPKGYIDIPANDKYLIPGLWDMHTHSIKTSPQLHHPLFIANGVTAVRDMSGCMNVDDSFWGCIKDRQEWTASALAGQRVSPRYILQSSYQTDGGSEVPETYPDFFKLGTTADAKKMVDFYKASGADFIKVHHKIPLVKYNRLIKAAKKADIKVAGHSPLEVSLQHAIESEQASIEHGRVFLLECFQDIEQYRTLDKPLPYNDGVFLRDLIEKQNNPRCQVLMQALATSDTWWVPTLTTLASAAFAHDETFINDARLAYIPYFIQTLLWSQDIQGAKRRGVDKAGKYVHKDLYQLALSQLGKANKAGVKILAGTDTLDSYVFAGSSLHDELEAMVSAGLSPLQALQAATISAAQFSRMDDKFGSIAKGMAADLLLLRENPLLDISNTKSIESVFFNGIYYDSTAISELKEFTAEQAQSLKTNLHFARDILSSPLMRMQLAD